MGLEKMGRNGSRKWWNVESRSMQGVLELRRSQLGTFRGHTNQAVHGCMLDFILNVLTAVQISKFLLTLKSVHMLYVIFNS